MHRGIEPLAAERPASGSLTFAPYPDRITQRRCRSDSQACCHRDLMRERPLPVTSRLAPVIDRVFPFDPIADAFAYLEKGHAKGKVVVRMAL
jgi:hypothetical protein